jgi:hypothetical protein
VLNREAKMTEKFMSRKFLFTLVLLAIGFSVDFFTDRGLSTNLKELIIYLGGIYVVGNSMSKTAEVIKSRGAARPDSIDPAAFQRVLGQLDQSLGEIQQGQQAIIQNVSISNQALGQITKKISSPLK